ncbi:MULTISPECIES: glycosyltransferase [unclassified Candidatus Frackibacter]|uniref:glycosyltransferase n=1 Tax=unclassified Candidatus Frackibacter TaxID=2648818 RepID=UPI00079461AA|nr:MULTISPECIES: glycosyltransferase [unclassified Candidatus Frackibacter]KXS41806.1 MAG: family 2 glycosyl transferase [Candidatus Frackibacter sp. T328-2]SDC55288.1 Glycosyl transferase family 2 [Candidatus Frackibacter sp. WG11]SEM67347.1 Glycosyl transferase family 2 [Candidatus Frackibacter sp. WG12]SFL78632.1 Glycosyl transferase family 2 [Candidatus Frackibacter sp. WG13]
MRLSVISPVLNEEFFIPIYLKAVLKYADEVVLLDGGSQDKTVEIIEEFQRKTDKIKLFIKPQNGKPYSEEWNEGQRRNFLVNKCTGDWILALDVDEFMSDNFVKFLPQLMKDGDMNFYSFKYIPFWKRVNLIRLSTPQDPHWAGEIARMGRRDGFSYSQSKHHCVPLYNGKPIWRVEKHKRVLSIVLYHYHYALGPRIKENDNRRGDVDLADKKGNPDWDYEPDDYSIKTAPFNGKHPEVIRDYLKQNRRIR